MDDIKTNKHDSGIQAAQLILTSHGDNMDLKLAALPPPDYLNEEERDYWRSLIALAPLGHWERIDIPILANYCKGCSALAKVTKKMGNQKVVIMDTNGDTRINPTYRASAALVAMVRRLSMRLGLQKLKTQRMGTNEERVQMTEQQVYERMMNDENNPRYMLSGCRIQA